MSRLRKVKMDQRKLMDNANTITDMAKVSVRRDSCGMKGCDRGEAFSMLEMCENMSKAVTLGLGIVEIRAMECA